MTPAAALSCFLSDNVKHLAHTAGQGQQKKKGCHINTVPMIFSIDSSVSMGIFIIKSSSIRMGSNNSNNNDDLMVVEGI